IIVAITLHRRLTVDAVHACLPSRSLSIINLNSIHPHYHIQPMRDDTSNFKSYTIVTSPEILNTNYLTR
ncbi:MAG: hypothetical protein MUP27_16240, partial [Desulfobacterales bacterium]|nr:hypothetical protein [Desulfobacterales bacterium]